MSEDKKVSRRVVVTLEIPQEYSIGAVGPWIESRLPGWKEIGVATTNWAEKKDTTHACPMCFDVHLPRVKNPSLSGHEEEK